MYIKRLVLKNIRTFEESTLDFIHRDQTFRHGDGNGSIPGNLLPKPRFPNVNLLLGDNGSGKSTVLRSIALAALGPAVVRSPLQTTGTIRRGEKVASITASLCLHPQDLASKSASANPQFPRPITSAVALQQWGDLEIYDFFSEDRELWEPVYETNNSSFFVVGYGATRRVERPENVDMGARLRTKFGRDQRVQGLFEDSFSLIPLSAWLPREKEAKGGHYPEVVRLLNAFLRPARYTFTEQMEKGDYLFEQSGNRVPFLSMSDGDRAFIGWVADLLYHISTASPPGTELVESRGIVMVDEIDLHLHPRWQMTVIKTVARVLPRMQFLFTSHSPLVASSLEWMNITTLKLAAKTNRTIVKRLKEGIHGLDADQVLLTDFFGLKSTRAPGKVSQLEKLKRKARHGDQEAARKIILAMSQGTEETE
jgi:hypothetical protein